MNGYEFSQELRLTIIKAVTDPNLSPKEIRKVVVDMFDKYPNAYLPVNSRYQVQVKRSKVLKGLIKSGYLKQVREHEYYFFNHRTGHSALVRCNNEQNGSK